MIELNELQKWCKELLPVVQAAANGEMIEYCSEADGDWYLKDTINFFACTDYRIKPRTIKVNGFDVPEPMSEAPEEGVEYFIASLSADCMNGSATWNDDEFDLRYLTRGICHATEEAAIAHAKAMLGIDSNVGDE